MALGLGASWLCEERKKKAPCLCASSPQKAERFLGRGDSSLISRRTGRGEGGGGFAATLPPAPYLFPSAPLERPLSFSFLQGNLSSSGSGSLLCGGDLLSLILATTRHSFSPPPQPPPPRRLCFSRSGSWATKALCFFARKMLNGTGLVLKRTYVVKHEKKTRK